MKLPHWAWNFLYKHMETALKEEITRLTLENKRLKNLLDSLETDWRDSIGAPE